MNSLILKSDWSLLERLSRSLWQNSEHIHIAGSWPDRGLLAEELMDRGRKLSRTVSESGSDASQQLVKRGQKTRKKWSQSKARLKKELRKRNRKAQQAQALRSNMFWLAFVCSA